MKITSCFYLVQLILAFTNIYSYKVNNNVNDSLSHATINDVGVQTIIKEAEGAENDVFLSSYYSTQYFSHLTSNFGNNTHGTCSYVAAGMLLSFYDTYWNDSIIDDCYDVNSYFDSTVSDFQTFDAPTFSCPSPGVSFESFDETSCLSNDDYLAYVLQHSSIEFQSKLIELSYSSPLNINVLQQGFGMNFTQLRSLFKYYLEDYRRLSPQEYSPYAVCNHAPMVENFTIQNIKNGIPVLIRASSPRFSGTHAMIAYDYDEGENQIYVHTGWKTTDGISLTHVSLNQLGIETIDDAFCLEFNMPHSHSNNFVSSSGCNVCSCSYMIPRDVTVSSGLSSGKAPIIKWKSLHKEKWLVSRYSCIKLSILTSFENCLFSTNIDTNEYELSETEWNEIIQYGDANLLIRLRLYSRDHSCFDEQYTLTRFDNQMISRIEPSQYGFADAYPSNEITQEHVAENGFRFTTRRVRTGFIHGEYVVMSAKKKLYSGYTESYIEYQFECGIKKIGVDLAFWRDPSIEGLSNANCYARLECFKQDEWEEEINLFDIDMPSNRNAPKHYEIQFGSPVFRMRFFACAYSDSGNGNSGRICIGNMQFFSACSTLPISGYEPSFDRSEWKVLEKYRNCCNYALNLKNINWLELGPLDYSQENYADQLINDVKTFVSSLGYTFKEVGKYQKCDVGFYKVAVGYSQDGYHWYRQGSDGYWYHKPGDAPVQTEDGDGKPILDPETCNRVFNIGNGPHYDASLFVGFYQINTSQGII